MEAFASYLTEISALIGSNTFFAYTIVFAILTLCGIGLPVPEDFVLILAGYFIFNEVADMYLMIAVAMVGILLGDYLIFLFGSRWGDWFQNHRHFKKAFSQKRVEKVHDYFDKYGNKFVFFARFFWGLRAATFFLAGTHTMSGMRFLLLDFLGALISIPLIIYLSVLLFQKFSGEIETAMMLIGEFSHVLLAVMISIVVYTLLKHYLDGKLTKPLDK